LRLLGAEEDGEGSSKTAAPPVGLVREYKGVTVEHLMSTPESQAALLPGQVRSMDEAQRADDLAGVSGHARQAVGVLLRGPGQRRPRHLELIVPMVGWLWFATLLGVIGWAAT